MKISGFINERQHVKTMKQIKDYLGGELDVLDNIDRSILYQAYDEDAYGLSADHIERVIIHAAALAAISKMPHNVFGLLLDSAKYHDSARENDFSDDDHGPRGAKKIERLYTGNPRILPGVKTKEDLKIVSDAICLHSLSDRNLNSLKKDSVLWTVGSNLKDADNLDRVRFDDLDVGYLRNPAAKGMVPFAYRLFIEHHTKNISQFAKSLEPNAEKW